MAPHPDIPRTTQYVGKTFPLPKEYQEVYKIVSGLQNRLPKNAGIPYHHVILMNSASDSHRLVSKVIFVVSQNSLSRFCRHCRNRFLRPTIKCVFKKQFHLHYFIGISISLPVTAPASGLGITTDRTPSL